MYGWFSLIYFITYLWYILSIVRYYCLNICFHTLFLFFSHSLFAAGFNGFQDLRDFLDYSRCVFMGFFQPFFLTDLLSIKKNSWKK